MTIPVRMLPTLALAATVLGLAACGDSETAPTADDHTPVSYTLLVNGSPATTPYNLTAGTTVRVQLKFVNAAGEDLDAVESQHFAGLTFAPTSLATVAAVADHHFQFDVTGGAAGTGTVQVGFGHDELADETTFPPATVTVTAQTAP
jgi:hypothetical protein